MQLSEQRRERRDPSDPVRWVEMRCVRCGRLLQKIEENALRPGKRIQIKCTHCKVMNYRIGAPRARPEWRE
jgi:phage FluMu protein Com